MARLLDRLARELHARRSVILCYHGVGDTGGSIDPGFLRVRPDVFRAQLGLLLRAGFEFVTVSELAERSAEATSSGLAALTFDDGMEDNYSVVLPILAEHGLPATIYVATGLIGKPNPWMPAEAGARMMNEREIREIAAAGFEIGAHTVTHPDLSQLDRESCLEEMLQSRLVLEEMTDGAVRTFAYPFCRYGPAAVAAAREAGFSTAVTCEGRGGSDAYELERSLITGKDGLPIFLLKLTDWYQPLFESSPIRLMRAATRPVRDSRRARVERRRGRGPR
jgi:peptidoglycan/xylan/chitin deacetylase (PgdA/CDA1 family)